MHSRFVRPETTILPISNGDTLTVKKRLTAGEERRILARMSMAPDNPRANAFQVGLAIVLGYLIDWTLTDDKGEKVQIRGLSEDSLAATLDSLDPESFKEIWQAIEAHQDRMTEERNAEKNGKDGGTTSPATLPSPVDVAGVMSGSRS